MKSRDVEPVPSDLTEAQIERLVGLLRRLAPAAPDQSIMQASYCALAYIVRRRSLPDKLDAFVSEHVERQAEGHRALKSLSISIYRLIDEINGLPDFAVSMILDGRTFVGREDIGSPNPEIRSWVKRKGLSDVKSSLHELRHAVEAADQLSQRLRKGRAEHPDKFLALGMAYTLKVVLGLKVAMTRDHDEVRGKPTSANYSQLLRLALELAGAKAPSDLLPIMRAGARNLEK